jgi:hypothetical protein
VMSDEVRALVDRRWDEYGIQIDATARDGQRGVLRQLLRR